jgi:hypothetical protein
MVDPSELVGDLVEPELREMPDVRRELARDARLASKAFDVFVEYSSTPSMKMANGVLTARSLGTRWPSVSVAHRCSSFGVKSRRRTK